MCNQILRKTLVKSEILCPGLTLEGTLQDWHISPTISGLSASNCRHHVSQLRSVTEGCWYHSLASGSARNPEQ